jgi:hypothetical protein
MWAKAEEAQTQATLTLERETQHDPSVCCVPLTQRVVAIRYARAITTCGSMENSNFNVEAPFYLELAS